MISKAKKKLDRRNFLKLMGATGISAVAPLPGISMSASAGEYDGPLYVTIAAEGGWDVTSFCDPKMNVSGELEINHWARSGEIQTAGNIAYAPFSDNASFFQRFYRHMLVVNGVDAQTNSHDAGVVHNWSGRLSAGYPSVSALAASVYGDALPIAYINAGGYRETAGLVRYSYLDDPNSLRNMLLPNTPEWDRERNYYDETDLNRVKQAQQARTQAMMNKAAVLPRHKKALNTLYLARNSMDQLEVFANNLPNELVSDQDDQGNWAPMRRQAQLALTAYISGMTVSCDLITWGFDTHEDHNNEQSAMMKNLTDGIAYLFDYAGELGVSDRLVVLVASDFGRTPFYNEDSGKDHWPIGSAIFMQENAAWGNRVVGSTDGGHNADSINPSTLRVDTSSSGTIIYPMHIQDAMRRLIGIDQHENVTRFALNAERFDFFNSTLST